ncbi:MAG TPA: hypothetical protein VMB78_10965 [Dissulfurispiraceae bacterium]|nr:hypothetical protein [Dissulfurispiraceae bacterium]
MISNKHSRSLPIFLFLFIGTIFLAYPALSHAEPSSYSVSAVENGQVLPPQPTTWEFHRDGRVDARGLWSGKWERSGNKEVHVIIIDSQGNRDKFVVRFDHNCQEFKAYQHGSLFRVGTRVSGNFCPVEKRY